jgi:pentalenic acid synthase
VALADIKVGGQTVPGGDGVVFALGIGNRDSAELARSVELDIARGARGHLALGFGVRQCPFSTCQCPRMLAAGSSGIA